MASAILFNPWKGSNYECGFGGLRTLVLGESHYQWDAEISIDGDPNLTIGLVNDQLSGEETKAFWTKIAIAFLNRKPSLEDKIDFWNAVAFYNYIQQSAGDGPRIAPPKASWKDSEEAFKEVVELLKPQFILILGMRLWYGLPDLTGDFGPILNDATQEKTWVYYHSQGRALAYYIKHPSTGFNGLDWHPHIMAAMALARAPLDNP